MPDLSSPQFGGDIVINQITDFDCVIELTISFFIDPHSQTIDSCLG